MTFTIVGLSRDLVVQGYGADLLKETGKIMIIARSIERQVSNMLPYYTG